MIINAINYCSKGKIEVTLKQNKHNVYFIISDKGIGIPKDELYDIFLSLQLVLEYVTLQVEEV